MTPETDGQNGHVVRSIHDVVNVDVHRLDEMTGEMELGEDALPRRLRTGQWLGSVCWRRRRSGRWWGRR